MDKASPSIQETGTSTKVIVITPEQIKKMGLESDLKSATNKLKKSEEPDNLILNIRSKLSTLLKPVDKPKAKAPELKGGITYKKIPIKKDGMPMGKLTRISMPKDKIVKTYVDKSDSKLPIDARILNMRTMLSKKMASEKSDESPTGSEVKQPEPLCTSTEAENTKANEQTAKIGPNKKIHILSVVPLNVEGNINESIDNSRELSPEMKKDDSIDLQNIDFVQDDRVHESKNAVPILHFRNASGAVIELFQETETKSDEEESVISQDTEHSEKREENGSTYEDFDDNSDSDVDRSKFKSYLKYSKFKRTKPISSVQISEETVESEQNEQSKLKMSTSLSHGNSVNKEIDDCPVESKMSDEEVKDIVELKPVPISQRTVSNASSENKMNVEKARDQSDLNSGLTEDEESLQADQDGLKPILKRKISTASVSEEATSTPIKRGRGRPKKSLSEGGPQSTTVAQLSTKSPVKSATKQVVKTKIQLSADGTPIIKKRGRPPKVPSTDESNKTSKSPLKLEVKSVKTYSKKEPITSVPISQTLKPSSIISKVPSMIKLEMDIGPEASVVVTAESSSDMVDPLKCTEELKPTPVIKPTESTAANIPRKRGRPRKSATPLSETPTPRVPKPPKSSPSSTSRDMVVSRSGRKRKKIDYSAMNEGESNSDDSYAEEEPPSRLDLKDDDFEEFSIRSSFNKEYEHKVYPAKRKSLKSESDTNEKDNKGEASVTEGSEITDPAKEKINIDNKTTHDSPAQKADEAPKKKRGRPKKIPDPASISKDVPDLSLSSKKAPLPQTTKAKANAEDDVESEHEEPSEEDKDVVKTPVKSRKKEMSVDSAFACMFNMVAKETDGPHPINIYSRTDFSAKLPPTEDRGTVVCALCEAEVPMKSFGRHNLTKHNNLAWKVGDDVIDLSNYGIVLGTYTDIYKTREKFACDRKCGAIKKSVMGYLSHYIVCQKSTEEVDDMKKTCEACGKPMMPFYYVNHLKDCKKDKKDTSDDTQNVIKRTYIKRKSHNHSLQSHSEDVKVLSMQQVLYHMLETIKANKSGVNAVNVYLRMDLEDLEKREPAPEGQAICALCNMEMESDKFELHNLNSHNNLSWKIGEPKLELDKYEAVIPTLNMMYTQRHPFVCEQCSTPVKSVWGFLWHVSTCGKTPGEIEKCKLECPTCRNFVVPTNYIAHTKNCHTKVLVEETLAEEDSDGEQFERGKKQRAAATKATQFIQQLTTTEDDKERDEDVLTFFYIDHKFFKSKKLADFMEEQLKNHKMLNCLFKNCDYQNDDVELLMCHLFACLEKPKKSFTCRICFAILSAVSETYSHIREKHREELGQEKYIVGMFSSSSEEDDEEDSERKRKKRQYREHKEDGKLTPWELVRIQDLQLHTMDGRGRLTITKQLSSNFPIAYKWNLEFVKQNFSSHLYTSNNSFSDWKSVLPNTITQYLPKLRTSFDAAFIKTNEINRLVRKLTNDYEWISLKLYEVQRANDSWTIFCGGPVHSLAWAPVYSSDDKEPKNYDQYLAVSVLSDPDTLVRQGQVKTNCGLLQIWNFGPLEVEKSMFEPDGFKPRLEYCLAHKHGDYFCMEWCPSGGFEKNYQLGLLAIGGTDTFVHIYEMPLGSALKKQGSIIFEAEPKYKLECMKLNEMDYSEKYAIPTCISWTKAKDHRYIAVGYCSGLIAIFDILTESPHLKSTRDNVIILKPYLVFTGHSGIITALSLHHMHGGNRWLASFAMDKTHKLWDLENHSQPIYIFTKVHMIDGIWPTHWLTTMMSYEDIVMKDQGGSTGVFVPIKRFTGTYFYFYNYFTRTNSLAVSDWSNMIAYCNVAGQIMGGFVNTCIPTTAHGMPALRYFNISITDVIDKTTSLDERKKEDLANDTNEFNGKFNEISYAPAKKRYGIVFCDAPINSFKKLEKMRKTGLDKSKLCNMNERNSPDMYPLRSATKIAINPNQQAHSYMAVGYQLGFVRIFCPYLYHEKI